MNPAIQIILRYLIVFAVGGVLCAIAQLLIVKTKLTPARILVVFLLVGIGLETVGVFKYMYQFAGSGVSIPILGFGAALAKGSIEGGQTDGVLGALTGGLAKTAGGIAAAILASYLITLIFKPKTKK